MSFFGDLFGNDAAQDAANDQKTGLNTAYSDASGQINTTQGNTNADYAGGLAPYTTNLATDQAGQTAYGNATGANGQAGYDAAVDNFHTAPGYQFMLDQGTQAALRNASKAGTLASGGTLLDLQKVGSGLADQSWQQYIQNLLPFVGASTANANGSAAVDISKAGTDSDLGKTVANMAWSKDTGIGNANAQADLARPQGEANLLNFGMGAAKGLMGFL